MQVIDAQIHEPHIGGGRTSSGIEGLSPELERIVNVELAREAIDSVGIEQAVVFASQEFIKACYDRYPERFPGGVVVFSYDAPDLEEQIAAFAEQPWGLGCRTLFTNYGRVSNVPDGVLELNPLVEQGAFDNYWALAAKYKLPIFIGAHRFAHKASVIAERHPEQTIIIDHFGVTQSLRYPEPNRWDALPRLLEMAKYPNVYVKLCGTPVISTEGYPYNDVWPYIHQILEAFGPERCMWASDYTRIRWGAEVVGPDDGWAPRSEWKSYADSLYYMLHSDEISDADREHIFRGTVQRALRFGE